ncbi:GIY-YIG nuclease family protein [Aliarcobacter butzleri]|uniref:GIY-YIG nuclease family protein n=1 Tax=Aliarcobacter butzleri TaxID=28197 RepID=UPI0021B3F176|nr:GIY-YIG nuclease family protein [Aliarcobacter butzleri]MCT7632117.1 RepB family plasmid replication initiator protein [Aliarcobacter butzleri]
MNQQTEKGYVYLLVSEDQKSFKIGKANEVNVRIDQLSKYWNFDLNSSYVIETDFNNTLNLERLLQRSLAYFKVEIFAKKDGYTEFFDIKGLDYILEYIDFLIKTNNVKIFDYNSFCSLNTITNKPKEIKKEYTNENLNLIQFSKINSLFELDIFFTICDKYLRTLEKEVIIKMTDIAGENTLKIKKQRNLNEERITQNLISFLLNPILKHNKPLINKEYRRSGKSFIFTINEDFFNKDIFYLIMKINHKKMFDFKSIYLKQMYILIKQLEKETTFTKEFLDNYFYLPPSLKEYASFKQRILTYASKELKDSMNINIKYKEIKEGKAVSKISISVNKKEKEEKIVKNIKQLEDNFNKQKEKQKPINNINYNIYKSYNYSYTQQTLINTSF